MEVNQAVVNGFQEFDMLPAQEAIAPEYADDACLSEAEIALWTNRVPDHEPWPRVMKGNTAPPPNSKNDEYKKNTKHNDQYDNVTDPSGRQPIGKVEGDEDIPRGPLWRR